MAKPTSGCHATTTTTTHTTDAASTDSAAAGTSPTYHTWHTTGTIPGSTPGSEKTAILASNLTGREKIVRLGCWDTTNPPTPTTQAPRQPSDSTQGTMEQTTHPTAATSPEHQDQGPERQIRTMMDGDPTEFSVPLQ